MMKRQEGIEGIPKKCHFFNHMPFVQLLTLMLYFVLMLQFVQIIQFVYNYNANNLYKYNHIQNVLNINVVLCTNFIPNICGFRLAKIQVKPGDIFPNFDCVPKPGWGTLRVVKDTLDNLKRTTWI